MKSSLLRLSVIPAILMLFAVFSCEQRTEKTADPNIAKEDLELDKIPKLVMGSLRAKFPTAEIQKWTKEEKGSIVIYDIEFKQMDRKFEADILEDGTIHNWEKEINISDLPETVKKTVENKYADAKLKEIMEITLALENNNLLEGYEVLLETADNKEVEVTAAPNGMILEDSNDDE